MKRRPTHPGVILEEDYIKPLQLEINLQSLADRLGIARKTLQKIRAGKSRITPNIALRFSRLFATTPELWLNLQQKYDLWFVEQENPEISDIEAIV